MSIRVALGSVPKDGGTFTFYRNMRGALLEKGIDLRCVTAGKSEALLCVDEFRDEGCVLLAANDPSIKRAAMAFEAWCEKERIDIVLGINSVPILSSLSHLPTRIRCLARCANGFDYGYKITLVCEERLSRIIAITPKLQHDLIEDYGADQNRIVLVPNGANVERFAHAASKERGSGKVLQLGFLGRLEHNQKGVFHLPKITRKLDELGVEYELKIAGDGKHRAALEKGLATEIERGQVTLLGRLAPDAIPEFLGKIDVFLFTSHIEGCPNALMEAMMAGCVPVSWIIEGITDFLLEEGTTGFLVPTGDWEKFAQRISTLDSDRPLLAELSQAGAARARERFSRERTAAEYEKIFKEAMDVAPPSWTPEPWENFKLDPVFRTGWRGMVPAPLKAALRKILPGN